VRERAEYDLVDSRPPHSAHAHARGWV